MYESKQNQANSFCDLTTSTLEVNEIDRLC